MADEPIYRGWDFLGQAKRKLKRTYSNAVIGEETREIASFVDATVSRISALSLEQPSSRQELSGSIAARVLAQITSTSDDYARSVRYFEPLTAVIASMVEFEGWFDLPNINLSGRPLRSELWDLEAHVRRKATIVDNYDEVVADIVDVFVALVTPLVNDNTALLEPQHDATGTVAFSTELIDTLPRLPGLLEHMIQVPFAADDERFLLWATLRARLEDNLITMSGGIPGDPGTFPKTYRLPTKMTSTSTDELVAGYLRFTPLESLFNVTVPLTIPSNVRYEHHHIVAGSGHGKTQTLQHLILNDLPAVAAGERSIVVIDSQSDLINTIASLTVFAPGQPLADRLVLIDPTDVEWPVALNLFDVAMDRIDTYSQLDQERLINGVLELYDFVLGSLLDAGMTQKQSVIFRYITRLLLRIPNATIHTFREILEEEGFETYRRYVDKLEGSARSFFENEYSSREFVQTRRQVLRRLYRILENQTFERMFSHPKSKLDLFKEMNSGKVILINTAKDLLKENGTQIFGRFFIAMIAQVAQERAVLDKSDRLPAFVYVDEANDYFDRNIATILSQARKYNVGMILALQFLGQLDTKLYEAIAANTSIKFAGGVSAKDGRTLANDLRCDATFIDRQPRLSFAAFVKGQTDQAASISVEPGQMEAMPTLSVEDRGAQRKSMRERFAVHYTQVGNAFNESASEKDSINSEDDDGEPMFWH